MNAKEFMAANETDRRGPKDEGKKTASRSTVQILVRREVQNESARQERQADGGRVG